MPEPTRSLPDETAAGPPLTPTLRWAADATWPDDVAPSATVGPLPPGYEPVRELGRGGMGVVYLARQTALSRDAAVKLILAGGHASSAARVRFVTEGEAVARVRHPHVIQVFEAGSHAGLPFLAMEFLPGGPLAAKLADGPLPPADAARLTEQVARGIAACHAAGILHRDIKPANVLLDADGVPKVADFGLAKLSDGGPTGTAAVMGTPSYMAPEQALATRSVGPAADVYSLGATLYDLLTGRPPFRGPSAQETLHQVLNRDPVPVRDLQPTVPADLQTVCMKCLEKDPARRYPSAEALADDLQRWREGVPILARPAGRFERAAKWVRRNRTVSVSAAAVFLALATGAGVSLWQAGIARAEAANARAAEAVAVQRESAEKAAREGTEQVSRFLQEVLTQSNAYDGLVPGRKADPNRTVKAAMDTAADRLDGRFADQPTVEAAVRHTIGTAYYRLGQYLPAERHLTRAVELWEKAAGPDDPRTLHGKMDLGEVLHRRGKPRSAVEQLTDVAARSAATLGPDSNLALAARQGLASAQLNGGPDRAAGLRLLEQLLADRRRVSGDRHPWTLHAVRVLAGHYAFARDPRAGPLLKEAQAGFEAVFGPDNPHTYDSLAELGEWEDRTGDPAKAAKLLADARAGLARLLGDGHPDTLAATAALVRNLARRGKFKQLPALLEGVVAGHRTAHGDGHPLTLGAVQQLGLIYLIVGEFRKAEPVLRELADGLDKAGHRGSMLHETRGRLGEAILLGRGDRAAAEVELKAAFAGLTAEPDPDAEDQTSMMRLVTRHLIAICEATGRSDEAARWRAEAARFRESAPKPRAGK